MVFLCIWVDTEASIETQSWLFWARHANVPELNVEQFPAKSEYGSASGLWQWWWLSLLASLARSNASCSWNLLMRENTYVFLPAVIERLTCLDAQEQVMLGHLQGRYDDRFPTLSSRPVPLLWLPAGLFVSNGWLQQEAIPKLDAEICSPYTFEKMADALRDQLHEGADFSPGDYSLSLCLAAAKLSNPAANFGFPLEHYVTGGHVLERLAFRARYAGAWVFNTSEVKRGAAYILGSEPPCVLVASPVDPKDFGKAEEAALALWARGCNVRHLVQLTFDAALHPEMCPDRLRAYGNSLLVDQTRVYSAHDQGSYFEQPAFSEWVESKLANCQAASVTRRMSVQLPSMIPVPSLPDMLVFLGLPGGATSWLSDLLEKAGAQGRIPDLLHPYLHEPLRAEMSMVLGAAEDRSYVNIFRAGDHSALSHLIHWILQEPDHANRWPKFTKEIINVARVGDLQKLGVRHLLALYRPRRYTFPVSDLGAVAGELCRSCFYNSMLGSFILQPCINPTLRAVRPVALALLHDAQNYGKDASGVVAHTLLWYLILRAGVPVLHYNTLMTENSSNIALAFDSASSGFNLSLAQRLGEEAVATRRSMEWMRIREKRYGALHVETAAKKLILALRHADPHTDLSIIVND